jgi:hypothetical protein
LGADVAVQHRAGFAEGRVDVLGQKRHPGRHGLTVGICQVNIGPVSSSSPLPNQPPLG